MVMPYSRFERSIVLPDNLAEDISAPIIAMECC